MYIVCNLNCGRNTKNIIIMVSTESDPIMDQPSEQQSKLTFEQEIEKSHRLLREIDEALEETDRLVRVMQAFAG